MRKIIVFFISVVALLCIASNGSGWGFWAHRTINYYAVSTLPEEMMGFYTRNREFLKVHAVDPDKKRFCHTDEGPRHYIDMDEYGAHPFDSLPARWKDAVAKYGDSIIKSRGTVPWQINSQYYWLVEAFKAKDVESILTHSATLGHYVADAYVPLHTTTNYDGQQSGQEGIHALWETKVPEYFSYAYHYKVAKAHYVNDPLGLAWKIVLDSYNEVDSVLRFEKELNEQFGPGNKYCFEKKGKKIIKSYANAYLIAYNKKLNNMAERKLRASILAIGSLWMSAWIDAGQPDLNDLKLKEMLEEEEQSEGN